MTQEAFVVGLAEPAEASRRRSFRRVAQPDRPEWVPRPPAPAPAGPGDRHRIGRTADRRQRSSRARDGVAPGGIRSARRRRPPDPGAPSPPRPADGGRRTPAGDPGRDGQVAAVERTARARASDGGGGMTTRRNDGHRRPDGPSAGRAGERPRMWICVPMIMAATARHATAQAAGSSGSVLDGAPRCSGLPPAALAASLIAVGIVGSTPSIRPRLVERPLPGNGPITAGDEPPGRRVRRADGRGAPRRPGIDGTVET